MRKNLKDGFYTDNTNRIYFENDWYGKGLPSNVEIGTNVYLNSSVGFDRIFSKNEHCLSIGNSVGIYDQFLFEIGKKGQVTIGDFSIFKGRILCNGKISIGKYCMISWSTFITDSWISTPEGRTDALNHFLKDPESVIRMEYSSPVILEDNVWIGFGCVIMPGVTIGEGAVVASKTVVNKDVAPYTVVGGSPMRVIKTLNK